MAASLKSEMHAFSRQVSPLKDVLAAMATMSTDNNTNHPQLLVAVSGEYMPGLFSLLSNPTPQDEVMYFEDLRDKSLRIIDNISDHAENCQRLQEALRLSDDRRDAKVQFFISVTLAVFSPLSFVVGFYGTKFVLVLSGRRKISNLFTALPPLSPPGMNFVGECPPDHDGLSACPGGIKELFWPDGYSCVRRLKCLVPTCLLTHTPFSSSPAGSSGRSSRSCRWWPSPASWR